MAAVIATSLTPRSSQATALYWTGATGSVAAPSDGTWITGGSAWSNTSTGISANTPWASSDATFNGDDGTHIVTVSGAVTATNIIFNNSGFTLSNPTTAATVTSPLPSVASGKVDTIGSNVTIQTANSASIVASGTTAGGKLILDGGTLKETCTSAKLVTIGGSGSELQIKTGGLLTSSANNIVVGSGIGSSATLTLDGGTASITRTNSPVGFVIGSTGGTGVITINTGTLSVAASLAPITLGDSATSTATLNMNGGTVLAGAINGTAGATSVLNFNGGTFKVNANTATASISNLGHAFVLAGGAIFDTNGTTSATLNVSQNLEHGGSGIDGGLSKISTGTLSLSGTNTFTGNTKITAGTLALANVNALENSPLDVTGAGTATFTVAGTNTYNIGGLKNTAGTNTVGTTVALGANSLTLGSNSVSAVTIANLSDFQSGAAIGLTSTGTVTLDGTLTLTLNVGAFAQGTKSFNIFDVTGGTEAANTSFAVTLGGNYSGSLTNGNGYTTTVGANTFTFNTATGNLSVTSVPEPSSIGAAVALALGLIILARRREARQA